MQHPRVRRQPRRGPAEPHHRHPPGLEDQPLHGAHRQRRRRHAPGRAPPHGRGQGRRPQGARARALSLLRGASPPPRGAPARGPSRLAVSFHPRPSRRRWPSALRRPRRLRSSPSRTSSASAASRRALRPPARSRCSLGDTFVERVVLRETRLRVCAWPSQGLDLFLAGNDVAKLKPDPTIYNTAAQRLGCGLPPPSPPLRGPVCCPAAISASTSRFAGCRTASAS